MLGLMKIRTAAVALLLALPAGAETVVSPQEFRDYAEGWTLYFEDKNGEHVGAEAFREDGEATWQSPEGWCRDGLWKPHGAQLCFYYGLEDIVQCWRVLRDEEGLKVRRLGDRFDPPDLTYRIVRRDRKPLLCGTPGANT